MKRLWIGFCVLCLQAIMFGCLTTCGLLVLTVRLHLRTHLSSLYFPFILSPPPFCLDSLHPPIVQPNLNDRVPFIAAWWIQHNPPCSISFVDVHLKTNLHNPLLTTFRYFYCADADIIILESVRVMQWKFRRLEAMQDFFFPACGNVMDGGETGAAASTAQSN